jgi:hypothetical protein
MYYVQYSTHAMGVGPSDLSAACLHKREVGAVFNAHHRGEPRHVPRTAMHNER